MYSPSRQTFQLAQGVGTDHSLFNFSFSTGKQLSIDATATATPKGGQENVIPQNLNVSSEMSVTGGASCYGSIPSHSAILDVQMNQEEESIYHITQSDVSSSSALPRSFVWSTESELALSYSDARGSGGAALTLRAKTNKMQNEAINAKHITAESKELFSAPCEMSDKSTNSNAQPATKASRFIWREVLETSGGTKSHSRYSSRYSYLNPELYGPDGYEGSLRAADAVSSSSFVCAPDDTESAKEVQAENLPEAEAEAEVEAGTGTGTDATDVTPSSTHDDSASSQREIPIDLTVTEAEGRPDEEGDKAPAFSAPVLWHFNPDEVLQKCLSSNPNSNSNSNSSLNCAKPVEVEKLSTDNSSSEDPLFLSSSAVGKSASLGSAQDTPIPASQEGEGAEMTVNEAERLLSRVLKKNVRSIHGECIISL
jgi:hypothetical protein